MAKFFGKVGFEVLTETKPSTWTPTIVERAYVGDVVRNYRRLEAGDGVNENVNLSNEISIVADPYAIDHCHDMRYVQYLGGYWKVTGVDVAFPRLKLTIGGVYNGQTLAS